MKIYIGVTKDNELYYIEWDRVDNQQRKTFSLCGGTYNNPITETQGENEARETLKDSQYWSDLDMLKENSFLNDFIDFEEVAEYIINTDGWENTNGEYNHFGEYKNEEIYLNYSSGGQHKEDIKDFKKLFVSEEDLKEIYKLWDKYHLKPLKMKVIERMNNLFNKYENKGLCSDQEVLIKYLEAIDF